MLKSGRVCPKWVCLHVISERMKMYSYHHTVEMLIQRMIPRGHTNLSAYTVDLFI